MDAPLSIIIQKSNFEVLNRFENDKDNLHVFLRKLMLSQFLARIPNETSSEEIPPTLPAWAHTSKRHPRFLEKKFAAKTDVSDVASTEDKSIIGVLGYSVGGGGGGGKGGVL